ncbi:MAG: bifunctional precorrin-2 dehydrogenase/sirohydrochlorin ferrochelatase [Chloroflexi bacterium]|nr:bifunctional precorrin-2 dehydrogenase/sirohydrochlorin ferrochelatase [Chloroflexota bacterium]
MNKGSQVPLYYPAFLNVRDRRCVVVGGGQVALRKVSTLLEHEADVRVISPDPCPELAEMAGNGKVHILRRKYRTGDVKGALLAIAATDDVDTNQKVAAEARRHGVLVNVVDDAESSDFISPSYLRRGDVIIAVSTGGRSPALARKIRTTLEKDFGHELASLARLIDEVRSEMREQGVKVEGDAWQQALDLELLSNLVRRGDTQRAKTALLDSLKGQQK